MNLTILTEEKEIFSGEVQSVQLPGQSGRFEVLKGHTPLVSTLVTGKIVYRANDKREYIAIKHGVVVVSSKKVKVFM